jgi:hypothetical protein
MSLASIQAGQIAGKLASLPHPKLSAKVLQLSLDRAVPGLADRVAQRLEDALKKGVPYKEALHHALVQGVTEKAGSTGLSGLGALGTNGHESLHSTSTRQATGDRVTGIFNTVMQGINSATEIAFTAWDRAEQSRQQRFERSQAAAEATAAEAAAELERELAARDDGFRRASGLGVGGYLLIGGVLIAGVIGIGYLLSK